MIEDRDGDGEKTPAAVSFSEKTFLTYWKAPRSVSAPALESAVLEQLRGIGRNPAMLREVLRQITEHRRRDAAAIDGEKADIEKELKKIAHEMNETVSIVGKGSSAAEFATDRRTRHRLRLLGVEFALARIALRLLDGCRLRSGGRGVPLGRLLFVALALKLGYVRPPLSMFFRADRGPKLLWGVRHSEHRPMCEVQSIPNETTALCAWPFGSGIRPLLGIPACQVFNLLLPAMRGMDVPIGD